jgi:hypothetical protein
VLVPVLEVPVLPVAWLLSLVVAPAPMQRMVQMVLPVVWLLSWRALATEITTRTPTPMPML